MIDDPEISVCIVTCNQQGYIEQCLRSVLEQEVSARFEVLVGDDCSDDETGEIIKIIEGEYPDVVTCFRRPSRLGASRNLQELLKAARGGLIARLDGDDYWLPGKLQVQLEYMRRYPDCSAVYTNAVVLDRNGDCCGLFNNAGNARFTLSDMVRKGNFLNNSSVLFRKQSVSEWLAIKEPLIDYRVHLLHAKFGYLGHIGKPLTAYRQAAAGSMVNENNANVRQLYWEALNSVPGSAVSSAAMADGLADFMRRVIFRSAKTLRPGLALYWWKRVAEESPVSGVSMFFLVVWALFKATSREVVYALKALIGRGNKKILYIV